MSARDELDDLRNMLGEVAFVNAVWAMRVNASKPVPKTFQRGWKWSPAKVVALDAYRRASDLERAGNGLGLR